MVNGHLQSLNGPRRAAGHGPLIGPGSAGQEVQLPARRHRRRSEPPALSAGRPCPATPLINAHRPFTDVLLISRQCASDRNVAKNRGAQQPSAGAL